MNEPPKVVPIRPEGVSGGVPPDVLLIVEAVLKDQWARLWEAEGIATMLSQRLVDVGPENLHGEIDVATRACDAIVRLLRAAAEKLSAQDIVALLKAASSANPQFTTTGE